MTTKSKSPKTKLPVTLSANARIIAIRNHIEGLSSKLLKYCDEQGELNDRVTIIAAIACTALLISVVEGYIIATRLY